MGYNLEIIKKYNSLKKKIDTATLKKYILDCRVLDDELTKHHDKLNSFPKGNMGLVEEKSRISPEYREATNNFNIAKKKMDVFSKENKEMNKYYHKHFPYVLKSKIDLDLIEDDIGLSGPKMINKYIVDKDTSMDAGVDADLKG